MANIKNLKKKINTLVDELIDDCQLFIACTKDNAKKDKAFDIIKKAVIVHNQLLDRANHPDGKDNPKLVKPHYASIRKDLKVELHKLFEEISALAK